MLTCRLADKGTSTRITAAQLINAFNGFFGGNSSAEGGVDIFESILRSMPEGKIMAPVLISAAFATTPLLYKGTSAAARDSNLLQFLLALLLSYCSISAFGAIPSVGTDFSGANSNFSGLLGSMSDDLPRATYSFAASSYELVVSPAAIIAYAALGGSMLLFRMFFNGKHKPPATTSFPDLDYRPLDFGEVD